MRKGIISGLILVLISSSAFAVDALWSSITAYTSTKANKTVPIEQATPIKVFTTASSCSAYVDNASGTGVEIPANTFVEIKTPSTVSNIVFACTSSGGTTIKVIK